MLKVILEGIDHHGYSARFKEKEIVLATLCLFPFSCFQFY